MARRYKDAPSILQDEKECFLSGTLEGLERHHIYGGANRRNSAKYGLWVWLRHDLHNEPPDGVHFNAANNRILQGIAQKAFMLRYPDKDFIKIFGRNYLDEPSNDNWEPD